MSRRKKIENNVESPDKSMKQEQAEYEVLRFRTIDDLADLITEAASAISILSEMDMTEKWVKGIRQIAQDAEYKLKKVKA